jgi:RimJ/RimL family protein N-acetyltransferase
MKLGNKTWDRDTAEADEMLKLRSDVVIRQLRLEDAERMYQWVRDPVIARAIGLSHEPTLDYTVQWIQRSLDDSLISAYALLLKQSHVGNVVLDKTDTYLKTSRLSVYLGDPSVRGIGVGVTGIYQAMADGFKKYGLHKIWLTVDVNNQRAVKSYTKLKFKLEGVLREEFLVNDVRRDVYYMGVLRTEFETLLPALADTF